MRAEIMNETIPLVQSDSFAMFSRLKSAFTFPLHRHEEYELNFIVNAPGVKRIVGDSIELINDIDLVLIGPWVKHGWFTHVCKRKDIREITIQFHKNLFEESFLQRNQMLLMRNMLERSTRGISFSRETILKVKPKLETLGNKKGFESVLELMSILHLLSVSDQIRSLSNHIFYDSKDVQQEHNSRIKAAINYINLNYNKEITLSDVAKKINMSESAFSRYFKSKTGISFIDNLIQVRLGHASRLLIDNNLSISEIAYECGFNNISNFNRIFKKKKGCTPKSFKENFNKEVKVPVKT